MGKKTVLLVDDDPGVRRSLGTTLSLVDIRTREAESGEEALRIVREDPPDLVVLDVRMPPGMDGFETFRRLRGFSKTPVIFLSALDSIENQMTGIEMGAWDYVSKDQFQPALLSRKIDNLLESARADRSRAADAARSQPSFEATSARLAAMSSCIRTTTPRRSSAARSARSCPDFRTPRHFHLD